MICECNYKTNMTFDCIAMLKSY